MSIVSLAIFCQSFFWFVTVRSLVSIVLTYDITDLLERSPEVCYKEILLYQADRLAWKNVSEMTYFVSGVELININSVNDLAIFSVDFSNGCF